MSFIDIGDRVKTNTDNADQSELARLIEYRPNLLVITFSKKR
jgi:hypothetical protein